MPGSMRTLVLPCFVLASVATAGSYTFLSLGGARAAQGDLPPSSPMVEIPAGTFAMGADTGAADEKPVHRVQGGTFLMDRTEVTNGRYAVCVEAGVCPAPSLAGSKTRATYFRDPAYANYPVIFVSWNDADVFCRWAGGRLPTEAEWERAARGTDKPRVFPWGDAPPTCDKANFAGCVGDTDEVGKRPAGNSPYGVQDMAGNVWEWTADWYGADYYAKSERVEPRGPATGTLKVMRGGCWVSGASSLRSTCRKPELPSLWAPNVGFRCVYAHGQR